MDIIEDIITYHVGRSAPLHSVRMCLFMWAERIIMPKKFTLVNWLNEDSFGVMPASAACISPDKLYVGCKTMMSVEILKISGRVAHVIREA